MKKTLLIITLGLLTACGGSKVISISDAETAGFQKDKQKIFQMIGAKDGWGGKWADESVEIYEYENADLVNPDVFKSAVAKNNISGWLELCVHKNIIMLSKGNSACAALKKL